MNINRKLIYLIFIKLILLAKPVQALEPWESALARGVDPTMAALSVPPFCQGNSGIIYIDNKYKNVDWKQKFGGDFTYINHYCNGKPRTAICYQYPEKEMKACLTHQLEGTSYAITHSSDPNYALLPFLYSERGKLQTDIGNYNDAISDFQTAINKNKKFMPPYIGLADAYIKLKKFDDAEKVIKQGLEQNPDHKSLLKKLKKLKTK